jgi:uncharacterized protein (DUF885 family)
MAVFRISISRVVPALLLFGAMPISRAGIAQSPVSPAVQSAGPDALAAAVNGVADEYEAAAAEREKPSLEQTGWYDDGPVARRVWDAREDGWLARLREMDGARLYGLPEWVTYGLLREKLEAARQLRVCRAELWNVSQFYGWHMAAAQAAADQKLATAQERANALRRFRAYPAVLRRHTADLREGLRLGYTASRPIVERVIAQLDAILVDDPAQSPLRGPARRDSTPAFRREWETVVTREVAPALAEYRRFLAEEYLPRARAEIGLSSLPDGVACYRAMVRDYTSVDISPDSLFELGKRETARAEAEMIPALTRFTGVADPLEARRAIRTDPKYLYTSREEMLDSARARLARARAALPRFFLRVPQKELVVEPLPEYGEAAGPPAYYDAAPRDGSRPARYVLNTSPNHRARMYAGLSAFHEGFPGHHFERTYWEDRGPTHPVTQRIGTSAFTEGWAFYTERLAGEMELYGGELERVGMLMHFVEALNALSVDPAVHARGWTREQAVASMMVVAGRPRAQAESYADRHATTPAQLVTYMLGYLEIARLRQEAEARLGTRFDLREFHDVVLRDGQITLSMLRQKVEMWVREKAG